MPQTLVKPTKGKTDSAYHDALVLWQNEQTRRIYLIGRLTFDGSRYTFGYTESARCLDELIVLPGFADPEIQYQSEVLFPFFAQRIMSPKRSDYVDYLNRLGLEGDEVTPWEQIVHSGGRRNGDTLQFIPRPVFHDQKLRSRFLINGARHVPNVTRKTLQGEIHVSAQEHETALRGLSRGEELTVVHEQENAVSETALLVTRDGVPLGYVPNVLCAGLASLTSSDASVSIKVSHVNGPDAPWHLRLAVELQASEVASDPFDDPLWLPINKTFAEQL